MEVSVAQIIVSLITLSGVIYSVWKTHHQTPAQKDKDVLANMQDLINQYRLKDLENQKEIDRMEKEREEGDAKHAASISNFEAVMLKRQTEYEERLARTQNKLQAYQIAYVDIRRIAVKYVPSEVPLPEVNGNTKDLSK